MSADVIDFYTRKKIPSELDRLYDQVTQELSALEFNHQLSVWLDFSSAAAYHAPEKDPA
jgi:hypothetical protein